MARKKSDVEHLTFEQSMKELVGITQRMESNELPLDEALALYERGQRLAARCGELLDQAELRVRTLAPSDDKLDDNE